MTNQPKETLSGDVRKLPMMPIRDMVIFPHMMTPFVVGRESTVRALEEALLDYPGCAVIITHDRWFLDRVATHILAFEGDSQVVWFEGNYADYEADRRRRLGAEADQPHRIRYKPLVRN